MKSREFNNLIFFLSGSVSCIILFLVFLYLTKTPLNNFFYQYILFPLTIGEGRITSKEVAYISLIDQLNFKRLVGEFKFIHIFLVPLIILSIKFFKRNNEDLNLLNSVVVLSAIAFLFNQIITANQIYIFSLIPFLAAILHLNFNKIKIDIKIVYLLFIIVFFSTTKFHFRFNIDRKFHDLENIDKTKAIMANSVNKNFNQLKWITKFENPKNELIVIEEALDIINEDNRSKTLITHYQFISTFLDKPTNILNRWYLWDNNTHPTENHKYFEFYRMMVNNNIKKNKVEVIYLLGQKNEIRFDNVKNYFTDTCFESKTIIEEKFSVHRLVTCKN